MDKASMALCLFDVILNPRVYDLDVLMPLFMAQAGKAAFRSEAVSSRQHLPWGPTGACPQDQGKQP